MTPLATQVLRFGVTAKLKRAVMLERGWRRDDDWYRNWPTFAPELVAAIDEARASR